MSTPYRCQNEQRRNWVAEIKTGTKFRQNGIDYLKVDPANQMKLTVHFINKFADVEGYSPLTKDHFIVSGGTRIRNIRVINLMAVHDQGIELTVDQPGDFTSYTLHIVNGKASEKPPAWMDPILSQIDFSFKINCPSDFDCRPAEIAAPLQMDEPTIDYMAKDYASFRRLMLDRMGFLLPEWKERNPADMGVALVELLAYAGDHLSYKQDTVAAEAYLGTARKRISLSRHARLLDYPVFEGASARAWVQVSVKKGGDGIRIAGPDEGANRPGTALLTRMDPHASVLSMTETKLEKAIQNGARLFETMHGLTLFEAHNEMNFYTWGDEGCRLPRGATQAFLCDDMDNRLRLCRGDVLIFEEIRSPETGLAADADPAKRHAVRLTCVNPEASEDEAGARLPGASCADPLFPDQAFVEVSWHEDDALPFDLCTHSVADPENPGQKRPVSVATGNIVLADHGQTVGETIAVTRDERFRPVLTCAPVTRQGNVRSTEHRARLIPFDAAASAASAFIWTARHIQPAISLVQSDHHDITWLPRRDLLGSDAFSSEFVVETREDGRAQLRFGDGVMGRKPDYGLTFNAHYRIGNGTAGNVGAEAISHLIIRTDHEAGPAYDRTKIKNIRNPLAARGGIDPETGEQIRQYAPQAFKTQERAVNASDYAAIAQRHPGIQQAAASVRWTGSWYTVYVTIDRKGGQAVDDAFIAEMKTFLDGYRMTGYDIEISGPRFVPLDIACDVCVKPGYFKMDVKKVLLDVFSSRELDNGGQGFFHPDHFTFGQSVYLSRIYAAAMAVDGVAFIQVKKFQRLGKIAAGELTKGKLSAGRLEIVRLDNDPSFPENGKIEFVMRESHV